MNPFRILVISLFIQSYAFAATASLVGCYHIDEEAGTSIMVFLPNGEYHHLQVGPPSGGGFTGLERGSYTWDSTTGALTASVITDTNGQWGLSHGIAGVPGASIILKPDGIDLNVPDEGTYSLSRVDRSETNALVGGWWFRDLAIAGSVNEAGGDVIFAFLPDGRYFMAQDGLEDEDAGEDGIESGTITWNPANGAFSIAFEADTNGEWGLSHQGPNPTIMAGQDGNHLILNPDENPTVGEEFVVLHRIAPGSQILSTWIDQQGLSGEDAAPNATPFPDRLPNLIRYALNLGPNPTPDQLPAFGYIGSGGTSPAEPIGSARLAMAVSVEQPRITLGYQQRFPLVGVALVPQSSPDLVEWHDIPVEERAQVLDSNLSLIRVSFALPVLPQGTNPHRFLRLMARTLD